jgi:hypothetical protein
MNSVRSVALPCWEWRTFISHLDLESLGLDISECASRSEIRILSLVSAHDVRIQEGHLELAWRKQVSRDGLELWDPVLESTFPLATDFVSRLFVAWGLGKPTLTLPEIAESVFLESVVAGNPSLRVVTLSMQERNFQMEGLRGSHSFGKAGGVAIQTLHLTHEDPSLLSQILQKTGLSNYPNTNFPQGLKQALDL